MTDHLPCEHGHQRRQCPHCENAALTERLREAERVSKRQSIQLAKAAQTIACTEKAIMCARKQGAAEARKPLEDALREAYDSLNPISLVDAPLAKRIRAALAGPEKDAPAEESGEPKSR